MIDNFDNIAVDRAVWTASRTPTGEYYEAVLMNRKAYEAGKEEAWIGGVSPNFIHPITVRDDMIFRRGVP
tara:strand:+ start:263 stop:472 length:210 start_codon:yes stop_codon:yes gene_type:complete